MATGFWQRWVKRWQNSLFGGRKPGRHGRRNIQSKRGGLQLERLEQRLAPATVQFGLASEAVLESAGTFTIPVTLSAASGTATTVPFTLGGSAVSGTDFSGVSASPVTIPAGQLAVNITGTLLTPADGTKTLTFTLEAPTGATLGATTVNTMTISTAPASPTTLSIANSSVLEPAPHGTVDMDFTVTRTGDLTSQITVGYTTVAGTAQPTTDFTPTTGTTTFASGSATATIAIPVFGNGVYNNPSLTFSVQLTGIVNVVGPPVTLASQTTFVTGSEPNAVVVGDVNGDGKPDLIVANYKSNTVSVLLNTTPPGAATPSFATQQTFATGSGPGFVALGDVNGDGMPDLIVANLADGSVSVLLNTTVPGATTPSFAAQQTFAAGSGVDSVALADVNGDGRLDIVAANYNTGTVSVLLNTTTPGATTPSFATQQTFAAGSNPREALLGDLNGDGKPDIVVADRTGNTVSVLLNTTTPGATTASFATRQTFAIGAAALSVALADLNGDGKLDIVTANYQSTSVSVLLNTTVPGSSTASFSTQQTFATGAGPQFVAVGDLNGDGKPDLIVVNNTAGTTSVLLNTTAPGATTASFATQQTFATGTKPNYAALGDLNGDGLPDIVVANAGNFFTPGQTISVLLNTTVLPTTSPSFGPAKGLVSSTVQYTAVDVGDINGDGKPDLVVVNFAASRAVVFLNTTPAGSATPTFVNGGSFNLENSPNSIRLADLNGDGEPDIYFDDGNSIGVLLNETTPGATAASFGSLQTLDAGAGGASDVVAADINGDGLPDLVAVGTGISGPADPSSAVKVLLNQTVPGSTTLAFAAAQLFAAGNNAYQLAVGDLNGDGRPDVAVTNLDDETVSVLRNTTVPGATTASFATAQTFAVGPNPRGIQIGDVNGDGLPDLVVANSTGNSVSVLLNQTAPGSTTLAFLTQQTFAAGSGGNTVALGDVNGDGKLDIVVNSYGTNSAAVLLNTTAPGATVASFASAQTFATGDMPNNAAIGDLNGDGRPDIVTSNQDLHNTLTVLLNTPVTIPGNFATGTITESDSPNTTVSGVVFQDFNANGTQDTGESGLAGKTVFLDVHHDGTFDSGDPSAVTATDGSYTITGVAPGMYLVRVDALDGRVSVTGSAAAGISITAASTPITGINFGAVVLLPAAPIFATSNLFGSSNPDDNTAYVEGLFHALLGRAPAPSEVQAWTTNLANGQTHAQAALEIVQSPEYRTLEINFYFQNLLHRAPAPSEVTVWLTNFAHGATESDVVEDIMNGTEYQSEHTSDASFAAGLYTDIFGRDGASSELTSVESELANHVYTRAQLIEGYVHSNEAYEEAIESFFAAFLHRDGTLDPGFQGWVTKLQNGESLGQVEAEIIGDPDSSEFYNDGAATVP